MMAKKTSSEPKRKPPSKDWKYCKVWSRIKTFLEEVPEHFESTIDISGVPIDDIYSFAEPMSTTLEREFVHVLNKNQEAWDPNGEYSSYAFVRRSEAFPDVLFMDESTENIAIGIELKSWYSLAKEGEPSYRFRVAPKACAKQDLLVIFPWALSSVISGSPIIFKPFVELARYSAEYRNYWWQDLRSAKGNTRIKHPKEAHQYPESRSEFLDEPVEDRGGNFGRVARIGLMDEYIRSIDKETILGIEIYCWRKFFKTGGEAYKDCGKQLKLFDWVD